MCILSLFFSHSQYWQKKINPYIGTYSHVVQNNYKISKSSLNWRKQPQPLQRHIHKLPDNSTNSKILPTTAGNKNVMYWHIYMYISDNDRNNKALTKAHLRAAQIVTQILKLLLAIGSKAKSRNGMNFKILLTTVETKYYKLEHIRIPDNAEITRFLQRHTSCVVQIITQILKYSR